MFARELPQLSPQRLADPACQGGLIRSKDAMESFFGHTLINVSNSLGPHCECAHAIRLPGSLPACLTGLPGLPASLDLSASPDLPLRV